MPCIFTHVKYHPVPTGRLGFPTLPSRQRDAPVVLLCGTSPSLPTGPEAQRQVQEGTGTPAAPLGLGWAIWVAAEPPVKPVAEAASRGTPRGLATPAAWPPWLVAVGWPPRRAAHGPVCCWRRAAPSERAVLGWAAVTWQPGPSRALRSWSRCAGTVPQRPPLEAPGLWQDVVGHP